MERSTESALRNAIRVFLDATSVDSHDLTSQSQHLTSKIIENFRQIDKTGIQNPIAAYEAAKAAAATEHAKAAAAHEPAKAVAAHEAAKAVAALESAKAVAASGPAKAVAAHEAAKAAAATEHAKAAAAHERAKAGANCELDLEIFKLERAFDYFARHLQRLPDKDARTTAAESLAAALIACTDFIDETVLSNASTKEQS